jgi:hypothetical protein
MTRPYEMPFYPVPPILGIVLNLVLTGVLVSFLVRTDPLALLLSGGWIVLGVVAYVALDRWSTGDAEMRDEASDSAPAGGEAGGETVADED